MFRRNRKMRVEFNIGNKQLLIEVMQKNGGPNFRSKFTFV